MNNESFTPKIFVGYELTGELRNVFHESQEWKKHAISMGSVHNPLIEVPYQDKFYIGFYLEHSMTTLQNLQKIKQEITNTLQKFCQNIDFEKFTFSIFPQIFIA